ncbi:MAG TPA: hypothetical protein VK021_12445 [Flavobacteriaceae bacterium]|nr:hypothetical protein [Flavobacteriaceae bacterium]
MYLYKIFSHSLPKSLVVLRVVSFLFFICFIKTTSVRAQEVYVRISPEDCINCNLSLFQDVINLSDTDYKFLFPKKFEGKRFERFNELYFENKILNQSVVFSDSLYQQTQKPLNDRSGVVGFFKDRIIFKAEMEEISNNDLEEIFQSLRKVEMILDRDELGISSSATMEFNYQNPLGVITDIPFKTLFVINKKGEYKSIELNKDVYQKVIKKHSNPKEYDFHSSHLKELKSIGKFFPEYPRVKITDDKVFINYFLPIIKLVESDTTSHKGVYNLDILSITDFNNDEKIFRKIDNDLIVENSYLNPTRENVNQRFFPTNAFSFYNDHLFRINQLIYNQEDDEKDQSFPLFSTYEIDKKEKIIKFDDYSDKLETLDVQKDSTLNSDEMIVELSFLSQKNSILFEVLPYAINLQTKNIYNLDWDQKMNNIHYQDYDINYKQLQYWSSEDNWRVLVMKKNAYYLNLYDAEWKLKENIPLFFHSKNIEDVRFTKDFIYLSTESYFLRMPNFSKS